MSRISLRMSIEWSPDPSQRVLRSEGVTQFKIQMFPFGEGRVKAIYVP